MLYHFLLPFDDYVSWLNVFRYITFRGMAAFLVAFTFVLLLQPWFIRKLKSRGVKGQPIRDDGPKSHEGKKGTPTMGGMMVVLGIGTATLLLCDLSNLYVWLCMGVMTAYGAVGFVDDWRKITQQNSKGLSERQKLLFQCLIAGLAACLLMKLGFSTQLKIPFLKEFSYELGYFFIPFVMLVVVGTSNAVNLTDGLDGLAIGPIMTVSALYGVFAYVAGHKGIANYLAITHVSGVGEVSIIAAAVVAAGLGFLWYNTFPAQVFMGDLGALALGGLIGFISVLVKQELLLIVAGGIFVIEALSVIIQRYHFKLTGRRVFRMAPIHHHFELKGWAEPKIIVRFWIISIVLALISLSTLKLR